MIWKQLLTCLYIYAGLCRTCEVFGVSQLVLNSMNITEDSQFQALSVSAEKWVPITQVLCSLCCFLSIFDWQVRVSNLEEYLRNVKQQGYSLVGVEQTAHSKCLTNYKFPLKTVLLLGYVSNRYRVMILYIGILCCCCFFKQWTRRHSSAFDSHVGWMCGNTSVRYHQITQRPHQWCSVDLGVHKTTWL